MGYVKIGRLRECVEIGYLQVAVMNLCMSKLRFQCGVLILFILNPFSAMCFACYKLGNRENMFVSTWVFVMFFSLLGYTLLPYSTMDITRHYIMYEKLKYAFTFSDFIFYESLSEKPDFFLDILYWCIGKIVDTHQIVGFLGALLYYGMMLGVVLHSCSAITYKSNKTVFLYLLFMFLALSPIYEFSGMRQGNAILLFLFIITIPSCKISEKKRILLLLLPCFLHFSLYPIVLLYLCTYRINRKWIWILFSCLLLSFFFFIPLMATLKDICSSLGGIGNGIANKIDMYIFSGEVETKLYSGSVIRFVMIVLLLFLSPILIYIMDKLGRKNKLSPLFSRFHYFFILFYGYLVCSSSSYILSRNLMLFKFLVVIYLVYIYFSISLKYKMKIFLLCLMFSICISGILSFFMGKEYQTVNFTIFYSNLFDILQIETDPAGYTFS